MSYATNLEAPSKIGTKETFLLCTEKWENRFCKSCDFELFAHNSNDFEKRI